jgi:hypothetical protein
MEEKGKIEKHFEKWEKIRAKGKWRYYLLYGSLLWGGIIGILSTAFELIYSEFNLKYATFRIIVFMIGGIFYGMMQWKNQESTYQQYKDL